MSASYAPRPVEPSPRPCPGLGRTHEVRERRRPVDSWRSISQDLVTWLDEASLTCPAMSSRPDSFQSVTARMCAFCSEAPRQPRSPYRSRRCRRRAKHVRLAGGPCIVCGRRAQRGRLHCGYHGRMRCAEAGCRRLAVLAMACGHHVQGVRRREQRLRREERRGRDAEPWTRVGAEVLSDEPRCRRCGEPSADVDHIVPLWQGGTDARSNLQGLCKSCHSQKTSREFTS